MRLNWFRNLHLLGHLSQLFGELCKNSIPTGLCHAAAALPDSLAFASKSIRLLAFLPF